MKLFLVLLLLGLQFDGATSYLEIPTSGLVGPHPMTVTARIASNSDTAAQTIYAEAATATITYIRLTAMGNKTAPDDPIRMQDVGTADDSFAAAVGPYSTTKWDEIAGTIHNNANRWAFLEGVGSDQNQVQVSSSPTTETEIGRLPATLNVQYFSGDISDVACFNRVLSDAEIHAVWYGSNQVHGGRQGWWLMARADGAVTTETDISGNGNDMTNQGATTDADGGGTITWHSFGGN